METYFSKFPTITYANNNIRDLSRRVKLGNNIRQIPTAFYPYDLNDNMRSDVVSYTYYNDADADWLIYITNGIVDPYYGWYLNDFEFEKFIAKKYGNLEIPQQKIAYWTTNWTEFDVNVTPGFYIRLPAILQKYYIPIWGARDAIIAYKRRPEDWIMNTNRILTVPVANADVFIVGDLVQTTNSIGSIIGTGEVFGVESNNNILQVGNVLNVWEDASVSAIQKRNMPLANSATIAIASEAVVNITNLEIDYWTPIYFYDMEKEINEQRKTIILLDKGFLGEASRGITTVLRQT